MRCGDEGIGGMVQGQVAWFKRHSKARWTFFLLAVMAASGFPGIVGPGGGARTLWAAEGNNIPKGERGELPKSDDGKSLNFDFETGDLRDWKAEGKAFDGQPIKGPIDQKRVFGEGKRSDHTGDYWIGGFEKLRDDPRGTLTSVPFTVTHPYASFLIGGGKSRTTRAELLTADDQKVFFTASGRDLEEMQPVIVDLKKLTGKKIQIRLVDEFTQGWGHINFDDFRFHPKQPEFSTPKVPPSQELAQLYPHAGLDAAAAAKAMKLPAGFKVQVGAAEPVIQQPVAMAIDDRGRVWVAEAFEYPRRAKEGEGKDRILVLEDTDGDGTLDRHTTFLDNLNLVSGIEVGFGGVWVGAAPYLLFIPDRNGDDKPDGPPEVLLDGWGYEDTHETLNAFKWGPDGWLYGCHGVFTHSKVGKPGTPTEQRVRLNAGIWRYHPVRHQFEVFAEGTSNPWGVDFDDHGQAFATACVIPHLFHVIQGARYERQAGNHFNLHTYADIKTIADHRHYTGNQWNNNDRRSSDSIGGGHAHAGAMIYLGGHWPADYRGKLFMNNIHGNRMNMDILVPEGSGFIGSHGPDFLLTGDQWSQMLYMTYGPDGQVWVIDWYDAQQCHHNQGDLHDRTNGRVYRIAYQDAKPVKVDLSKATDEQLVAYQTHENDWYVRHARRQLQERAAQGKLSPKAVASLVQLSQTGPEPRLRLRGLWSLHAARGLQAETLLTLLGDESPQVRSWAIQVASETSSPAKLDETLLTPVVRQRLSTLAANDPSPQVRLYLASALQRLPLVDRWSLLEPLVTHAEDAADHNLPLMYWYAAEPLAEIAPQRALAWALVAGQKVPLLQQHMIRRIGSGAPEKSLALLIEGLTKASTPELQTTFLRGLNEALRGRGSVEAPVGWANVSSQLMSAQQPEVRLEALSLGATFGDSVAKTRLRELIADDQQPVKERRTALTALLKTKDQELSAVLRRLLAQAELRGDALRALAAYDDPQTPAAIVDVYRNLGPSEQRDALATLSARVPYAQALFRAVEQRQIPAGHLTADLIRQLKNLKSDELNAVIERVWGTARESTADKAQLIEQYKNLVMTTASVKPDLELGRAIFAKTCQQCHSLFATGGKVGPDLTGSNRANLDYILSNVLDPSAVMAKEYQPSIIVTNGGRVITGIVKESGKDALTVQTVNELVIVPLADIDERKMSDKSMMPDDLLKQLGPREVRSLIAYLASPGQVPILATADNLPLFFNGRDLTGWRGDEHLWRVENGEIIGRSPGIKHNDFLVSEMAVGDFRLSFEVKLAPNGGNSGVQFRSEPQANGEVKGYQADIGAGWWGKLYEELGRGLLTKKSGEEHVRVDDWNRYEIQAVGSRIQTWINGQPCVDLDDPSGARRGVIAFQLHSGGPFEVRYRKLSLSLLKANGGPVTAAHILQSLGGPATTPLSFRKQQLDTKFRSEGVAYGDFNNDGQLDIAAGSVWFEAPQWKPQAILEQPKEFSIRTYSDTFCNWAEDLDGDGYQDLIIVDFPGNPTWWFRNPGRAGGAWQRNRVTPVTNNESPNYLDVDRDGRRELLLGYSDGNLGVARPGTTATADWVLTSVSGSKAPGTEKFSHGLGVGDLNLDGRDDLLVTAGWWEAPSKPTKEPWKFHPAPFGQPAAQMYVYDFDGDGDQDVLSSSAHKAGLWWHEQTAPEQWKTHEIDASIAQTHALVLADMNGDGLPDFVTGKRFYAHNGNDPGEDQPATLFWYELSRENGKPKWTPHQIDHDSGVGTQFEVVDMNRDGLLDVIISNKKGVFYFEQSRGTAPAKSGGG